jgi:hypothetical protein
MSSVSSPRACRAAVRGNRTARIVAGTKKPTRANADEAPYAPASSAEKRAFTTRMSMCVRRAIPTRPTPTGAR